MFIREVKFGSLYLKIWLLSLIFIYQTISQESYIIPDAGAPGMNVYVEFIGVSDSFNYFTDQNQSYFNNNDADANTIKPAAGFKDLIEIGPFVSSWSGRMLSAQIFVNPDADPQTFDYNSLSNQFKVPIIVTMEDRPTFTYIFHVINPYPFGDKSGEVGNLGEGNLGIRSPKNTIVVDSMLLGSNAYNVSILDPDLSKNGNQSYLPLVILSKGPITGDGASINVSAIGKNGGPGGGGGAGKICDDELFNDGSDGGNGFTGGGAGGANSVLSGETTEDGGVGSGSFFETKSNFILYPFVSPGPERTYSFGGGSINGVLGGSIDERSVQSSGGGTGHPFGRSAVGNSNGSIVEYFGEYGAGSGNINNRPGGSASNATLGSGDPSYIFNGEPNANAGKIHGNDCIVPLAGGSGGGSGNPNNSSFPNNACSGDGGGGGGALRIFAPSVQGVLFESVGSPGENGDGQAHGGNGSGGAIELSIKTNYSEIDINTSGGLRSAVDFGGSGRVRLDLPKESFDIINQDANSSRFVGFSTDTSMYVQENHQITGFKDPQLNLDYYIKFPGGDWQLAGNSPVGETAFNLQLNMPIATSEIWYGVAIADIPDSQDGIYDEIPSQIFSQAAANVFIIENISKPEIDCLESININLTSCNSSSFIQEFEFSNLGNQDLNIDFESTTFSNSWLSFVNNENRVVSPNEKITVDIEIDFSQVSLGRNTATISIPNNDEDENPKQIEVIFNNEELDLTFYEDGSQINEFLSEVCFNENGLNYNEEIELWFNNSSSVTIEEISFINNVFRLDNLNENQIVNSSSTITSSLVLNALELNPVKGEFFDTLSIVANSCTVNLPLYLAIENDFLILQNPEDLQFDATPVNQSNQKTLTFKFIGVTPRQIFDVTLSDNTFQITGTNPHIPSGTLFNNGDIITLDIEFSPVSQGQFNSDLEFSISNPCLNNDTYGLSGEGNTSNLSFIDFIDFGDVEKCQILDTLLEIKNSGAEVNLGNTISFISDQLDIDLSGNSIVPANSSLSYTLSFNANTGNTGTYNGFWSIDVLNDPTYDELKVDVTANVYELEFEIDNVNLGELPYGVDVENINTTLRLLSDFGSAEPIEFDDNNTELVLFSNTLDQAFSNANIRFDFFNPSPGSNTTTSNLILVSDKSCTYLVPLEISGNFVTQDLGITPSDEIILEPFSRCDESEGFVVNLSVLGLGRIKVFNHSILGDNTTLFSTGDSNNFFVPIDNQLVYRIDASSLEFGEYSSTLSIDYLANGESRQKLLPITYSKKHGAVITQEIDFGVQFINTVTTRSATITKDNNWNLEFDNPDNTGLNPVFSFNQPYNLGNDALIPPIEFGVNFLPNQEGSFTDTLIFPIYIIEEDCKDTLILKLKGSAGNGLDIIVNAGSVTANENFDRLAIPIDIVLNSSSFLNNIIIDSLLITMNRTVFHPDLIPNGDFNSILYPDDNTIQVNLNTSSFTQISDNILRFDLSGLPLLGNQRVTEIIPSNLSLENNRISSANYNSGSFTLTVCNEGGDRLLQKSNELTMNINDNPQVIDIELEVLEVGDYKLEMRDINGNLVFESNFINNTVGGQVPNIQIDKTQLASGYYYIVLLAPNSFISKSIIINI